MGDDDTIEVVHARATRLGASRAGRASMPPRRLEQELNEAAKSKSTRTTVETRKSQAEGLPDNAEKSDKISEQLSLIVRVVRDHAEQQNKRMDRHEKLIEQYGNVLEKHIQETKAELALIREEHGNFAKVASERVEAFNKKLEERLDAVDSRVEAFTSTTNERLQALSHLFSQINTNVTTVTSYADALKSGLSMPATGTTSQGTPITQICSINPSSSASQQGTTSSPHVVIDFPRTESSTIVNEKPGAVRKRIDDALQSQEATQEIRCWGISRNPRDGNKFKVFFKDEDDARTVRQNDAWLIDHFRGARLQAEQWFPVRVDSVYKGAILSDMQSKEVKEGAAQMVGEENGVHVHKIQWLSKPNADKIHGSMVLYLARRSDAEKLLREVRVDIDGETGFARPYERRVGPIRCFKCHQFNHVAAKCPSPQMVCSRCASAGHSSRECTSERIKCATCGGPHSTFDRDCRAYKMECEKTSSRRT